MSVSFRWEPCSKETLCINSGCAIQAEQLKKVFGEFPLIFSQADLDTLEVIKALADNNSFYVELISLISTHNRIKVWLEY